MWLFKKKKSTEKVLQELLVDYFQGVGMEKIAKFQAIYGQEEHFKQREIERLKLIKEKFNFLQACKNNNMTLTIDEEKEYVWSKYTLEGKF